MDASNGSGIDKAELGRRVREARHERGMTLKEMDRSAGLSATHISEIERGKTSPTIGALIRIARALGREPSYFVEPEVLPDVSRSTPADRQLLPFGPARMETQTSGIPGGRLLAMTLHLDPAAPPLVIAAAEGALAAYVVTGSARIESHDGTETLGPGDSIHLQLDEPARLMAIDAAASLFVVTTAAIQPAPSES